MVTGHLAIVLHAHLPWVRHPEHDRFLEEYWLFEAVAECYLPLLRVLRGWIRDEVDWKLTLGITPTLAAMWADPEWLAYTEESAKLGALHSQENRLMSPASFFPISRATAG
jgi:1,4-alpha-glucan branching enzyme